MEINLGLAAFVATFAILFPSFKKLVKGELTGRATFMALSQAMIPVAVGIAATAQGDVVVTFAIFLGIAMLLRFLFTSGNRKGYFGFFVAVVLFIVGNWWTGGLLSTLVKSAATITFLVSKQSHQLVCSPSGHPICGAFAWVQSSAIAVEQLRNQVLGTSTWIPALNDVIVILGIVALIIWTIPTVIKGLVKTFHAFFEEVDMNEGLGKNIADSLAVWKPYLEKWLVPFLWVLKTPTMVLAAIGVLAVFLGIPWGIKWGALAIVVYLLIAMADLLPPAKPTVPAPATTTAPAAPATPTPVAPAEKEGPQVEILFLAYLLFLWVSTWANVTIILFARHMH